MTPLAAVFHKFDANDRSIDRTELLVIFPSGEPNVRHYLLTYDCIESNAMLLNMADGRPSSHTSILDYVFFGSQTFELACAKLNNSEVTMTRDEALTLANAVFAGVPSDRWVGNFGILDRVLFLQPDVSDTDFNWMLFYDRLGSRPDDYSRWPSLIDASGVQLIGRAYLIRTDCELQTALVVHSQEFADQEELPRLEAVPHSRVQTGRRGLVGLFLDHVCGPAEARATWPTLTLPRTKAVATNVIEVQELNSQ